MSTTSIEGAGEHEQECSSQQQRSVAANISIHLLREYGVVHLSGALSEGDQ